MRQAKQTLKELMAGLAVWGILVLVILMIVSRHRLAVAWTFGGTGSSCVASLAYVPPSGYCAGYGCDSCGEAYSGFCDEKISGNGGCSGVGHDTVPLHSSGWNSAWDVWNENICLYAAEDSQAYGVAQGFFCEVITMTDCDEYSPLCGGLHI